MPKTLNFVEDKEKAVKSVRAFLKEKGGQGPIDIDKWFDEIQKSHKYIRDIFKGISISRKVELKATINPLDTYQKTKLDKILEKIPKYLQDNNIKKEDLYLPTLPSGMKCTKSLFRYVGDNIIDKYDRYPIEASIGELGNFYSENSIQDQTLYVTLTTEAKAFTLIGHYGADVGSCFAQYGGNTRHKYSLGQSGNTFVVLFSTQPIDIYGEIEDTNKIIGRAWGFFSPKKKIFNITNYYAVRTQLCVSNAIEAIKKVASELLGTEIELLNDHISIGKGIYHNRSPNWSFIKKGSPPTKQQLKIRLEKF